MTTFAPSDLAFQPLGSTMGARVVGIDLTEPLPDETGSRVLDGFHRHRVLLFRGQQLTREQQIAATTGRSAISSRRVAEHREVVGHYGLPSDLPDDCDVDQLITLMTRDKKADRTGLAFVLDGPGGVEVVRGVPESTVRTALEEMRHAPCPTK